MKIRYGFISNSSTTSFILGIPKHNLRTALEKIFQNQPSSFESLLVAPYETSEKVIFALLPKFQEITPQWLEERKNWVWIDQMQNSYEKALENRLTPYFIKLDIVMQPELANVVQRINDLSQEVLMITQIKYP